MSILRVAKGFVARFHIWYKHPNPIRDYHAYARSSYDKDRPGVHAAGLLA